MNGCLECCRKKPGNPVRKVGPMKMNVRTRPFQELSSDVFGPLPMTENGYQYILTIIDAFTRWTVLFH